MSNNFPFIVYESPDGFCVATTTQIIAHNVDEVTAKRLTRKALDLPKALINEAFLTPTDVLTWRATFQQASVAMLAELNEAVEDIADVTAEELADLQESVATLNEAVEEQALTLYVAELRRRLAEAEAAWQRAYEGTVGHLNKNRFHPNVKLQNARMAAAATWATPLGERVLSLRQQIKDLE